MPNALLSTYDKSGLVEFARALHEMGWRVIASGGTAHFGAAITPGEGGEVGFVVDRHKIIIEQERHHCAFTNVVALNGLFSCRAALAPNLL